MDKLRMYTLKFTSFRVSLNHSLQSEVTISFRSANIRKKIVSFTCCVMSWRDTNFIDESLFRHIFETQVHIQTQIRKTFKLSLATNNFL